MPPPPAPSGAGPFTGWIRLSLKDWKPVATAPDERSCWDQTFHYKKIHDLINECVVLLKGIEPNPGHSQK